MTLVGEGPERATLETLIARHSLGNCVRLTGACNHDEVADYYAASDAFVL